MKRDDLERLSVAELENLIRHHNRLYWDEHRPEISDYEYDRLVERLRKLAPDSPVLEAMGPSKPADSPGAEVRHRHRMLSLDKCYSETELQKWAASFEGDVVASPKFDGIACSLHYNEHGELTLAATRGDGEVGENITANARAIQDIPTRIEARGIEVRGEIFMRLSVFKRFRDQGFANPRNLAAGAIKQKSVEKSAGYQLSFVAYDLLGTDHDTEVDKMQFLAALGFTTVEWMLLPKSQLQKGYERFAALRPSLDFEIDGVVFKANLVSEQRRLGSTAHHPRYAIAYKFQGDSATTVLRDVEWSVARSGVITPVGIIDPVNLSGATVSRASLHNVGYVRKLGLTRNAEVVVMRRGGVIPNLEFVSKPGDGPIEIPSSCPSCGGPVRAERDFLYCAQPQQCRGAVIGQLAHFAATTGMLGFGDVILAALYDKGWLRRPADFYSLTEAQLLTLDRMGTKGARKLLAEVDRARTLDLATFLRAFGLPEVGKHVSSLLVERYRTLDRIYQVTEEELGSIHSIGPVIARTVVQALADARDEIEAVRKHVTLVEPGTAEREPQAGPFHGQSFVFTGKMASMERKEAEALVQALGGTALDTVTRNLTFLVVGDDRGEAKSSKLKTAEKYIAQGAPIRIITEREFLQKVEQAREHGVIRTGGAGAGNVDASTEDRMDPPVADPSKPMALVSHPQPSVPLPVAAGTAGTGETSLRGSVVVFAGKLGALRRDEAEAKVRALGGQVMDRITDAVTHVVVGTKGKPGTPLAKAQALQLQGKPITILQEADFLALVDRRQGTLF